MNHPLQGRALVVSAFGGLAFATACTSEHGTEPSHTRTESPPLDTREADSIDAGLEGSTNSAPAADAPLDQLQAHLSDRLDAISLVERLAVSDDRALLAGDSDLLRGADAELLTRPIMEYDARSDALETVTVQGIDARYQAGTLMVVESDRILYRVSRAARTPVLDRVAGYLGLLSDGALVVPRASMTGGVEGSDLWLVPPEGEISVFSAAQGYDYCPVDLRDGRLVFVSTRSTVVALWLGVLCTGEVRQLTNRGLRAGQGMAGFVPPPGCCEDVAFADGTLTYAVEQSTVTVPIDVAQEAEPHPTGGVL